MYINYNSLILIIRRKFGSPLQVYSNVVLNINYIVCYLPTIVGDQFLIGTLHRGLGYVALLPFSPVPTPMYQYQCM